MKKSEVSEKIVLLKSEGASQNNRIVSKQRKSLTRSTFVKNSVVGTIPYMFFLIALLLVSIGFFNYVENESVLAVFLTQKDNAITQQQWEGTGWSKADVVPTVDPTKRATIRDGQRLLTPFFYIGQEIGKLHFPRINLNVPVIQGDNETQFRLGAGHSTGSYLPGQDGNIIIGAHRTTHFRNFEYVKLGDEIKFDVVYGSFTYKIDEIRIIKGGDNSIAKSTSKEQLTLYTCYPFVYFGNAPKRYVLICSLIESEIYK